MGTMLLETERPLTGGAALDWERLQGTWACVAGTRAARLLIATDRFTVHFKNGDTYMGLLQIDPAARPKVMEMEIAEGPERHRGKTAYAIYALDGDKLIWSPNKPGLPEAPKVFPPPEDRECICIVFQREKP